MSEQLLNIGLAFLEGIILIISPCILPILPIILSGSLEGGKKRPLGIILGFILAFTLFTLFSRTLVQSLGFDLNTIRNFSFILLFLFGLVMISDYLAEQFSRFTHKIADIGLILTTPKELNETHKNKDINSQNSSTHKKIFQQEFFSGLVFGALVGLIWTPCAGPILAAVIVQTVIQKSTFASFWIVLAFGIGAALPMLFIALAGKEMLKSIHFLRKHTILIRKLLGVIIIASVVFMYFGGEWALSLGRVNTQERSVATENNLEKELKNSPPNNLDNKFQNKPQNNSENLKPQLIDEVWMPYPAPPVEGITNWINSDPLQIKALRGKVILIDFWAYSCINCIRTLPFLKDWYQKYHDKGLVIIGVHSPEFQFESELSNVEMAVKKEGILYPVALDNHFTTWENYHNLYWPAHYLINKDGLVVYHHHGEGNYDVTEHNIQVLLGETAEKVPSSSPLANSTSDQTPETYLGYERATEFKSPEKVAKDVSYTYTFPKNLEQNEWALQGDFIITPQRIISNSPKAAIRIHFKAAKVFAVMGNSNVTNANPNNNISNNISVQLNYIPLRGKTDTKKNVFPNATNLIKVNDHKLYTLIDSKEFIEGILELTLDEPGLEIYTFTFGN